MLTIRTDELLDAHKRIAYPSPAVYALVAAGFATVWLVASPVPTAVKLTVRVLFIGAMAWLYLRQSAKTKLRANNYAPMKPDRELERTKFTWHDDARPMLALVGSTITLQLASNMNSAVWGLIPAIAYTGLLWFIILRPSAWPSFYVSPAVLFGTPTGSTPTTPTTEFSGANAVVTYMHAQILVPKGFQRLESALVKELVETGHDRQDVLAALDEAVQDERVVRIREMRHRGGTDNWLTLTEKSTRDYQRQFQVDEAEAKMV